jgi:hypothetical protein
MPKAKQKKVTKFHKRKGTKRVTPNTTGLSYNVGNQFWKYVTNIGREKLFATPELLWEEACKYFDYVDKHPWDDIKWKDKAYRNEPRKVPYSMMGLCLYLGVSQGYFRAYKCTNPKDADAYLAVIDKIQHVIQSQQFNGASAGYFKENIISRMLGLAEHTDVKSGGQPVQVPAPIVYNTAPPLADNEDNIK